MFFAKLIPTFAKNDLNLSVIRSRDLWVVTSDILAGECFHRLLWKYIILDADIVHMVVWMDSDSVGMYSTSFNAPVFS